jgi:hypothetical protein
LAALAALAAGTLLTGSLVFPYNERLAGSAFTFPLNAYLNEHFGGNVNALGFGKDRGANWPLDPFPGHSPLDATVNANLNGHSLNTDFLGWPTGSLLLPLLFIFSGALRRTGRAMTIVILVVIGVYSLYWFSGGPDFGARYWYTMLPALLALSACGVQWIAASVEEGWRVHAGVLLLCAFTVINYIPWRSIDKYHHYLNARPDISRIAAARGFDNALVLIQGPEFPDYASAAAYNAPVITTARAIYAWDKNPETRRRLLAAFPDRAVWILRGPTLTRRGYEVSEGPTPVCNLLAQK